MEKPTGTYIGTSGWSYPRGEGSWKGFFYPAKVNELQYYGSIFKTVEVNSSFYHPPSQQVVYNWLKRVPEEFIFSVKLWQKFTHPKMYKEATGREAVISERDVALFEDSLKPLVEQNRLGALLAQFPPSFKNNDYNRQILKAVIKTFGHYPLAVELRDISWSDDKSTAELLKEAGVCWVQIDEPRFESSIAGDLPITSEMAYFRFHGRNREMWWQGDNETRYRYLYSEEEIEELSRKVKAAGGKAKLTFVFFNNHWQGYAPRNAVQMIKSLKEMVKDIHFQEELSED